MANVKTAWPLLQAVVQTLRADTALQAVIVGGEHEGVAAPGTKYPFLTYQLGPSPRDNYVDSIQLRALIYVMVHDRDQVRARNTDALVMDALQDVKFNFAATEHGSSGQDTLVCQRILDVPDTDTDDEGQKVYQYGGVYEVWIDQPL